MTTTLRLGTLVSPATFRHPSVLAKSAVTADHISGGRIELGIGTGWHAAEHRAYGFPFPPMGERMDRLAEQLEIIHRPWTEDRSISPGSTTGSRASTRCPKPVQRPHPPLIIGGAAGPRGARSPRAGRTSTTPSTRRPSEARERRERIDAACARGGPRPGTLRSP